jgi:hypothetical protein
MRDGPKQLFGKKPDLDTRTKQIFAIPAVAQLITTLFITLFLPFCRRSAAING